MIGESRISRTLLAVLAACLFLPLAFLGFSSQSQIATQTLTQCGLYSFAPSSGARGYSGFPSFRNAPQRSTGGSDYLADIARDGVYHWLPQRLPLRVFISAGHGVPGYQNHYPQLVEQAFDEWVAASNNKLGWVQVSNPAQADVTVAFTANLQVHGDGAEAGRTESLTRLNRATGRGVLEKAKVSILTRLGNRNLSEIEVRRIALHEVGHAFGLQGHSPNPTDIMYYATTSRQPTYLTARDKNTIQRLYASYPTAGSIASVPRTTPSFGFSQQQNYDTQPTYGFAPQPRHYAPRSSYAPSYGYGNGYAAPAWRQMGRETLKGLALEAARRYLQGGMRF
jgi:predicted Zn-dependent protease